MSDDRLIVAMDVPNVLDGLALANELKQDHGKRIFLDMKFFDIGATVEAAVRGIAQFDLDFLTVHGDPHVVAAAKQGAAGSNLKILAVTILTSLDRDDLDASCIKDGAIPDLVRACAQQVPILAIKSVLQHQRKRLRMASIISWLAARSGKRRTLRRQRPTSLRKCRHLKRSRPTPNR